MSKHRTLWGAAALAAIFAFTCLGAEDTTDLAMLERVAAELAAAAPVAKADDQSAFAAASRKLADAKLLAGVSEEITIWGGQAPGKSLNPDEHNLNKFDNRAWRALYLATFMFPGTHTVKRADGFTVLTMDCQFRNGLDAGDYPYPFWHSQKKWQAYQQARHLLFLFQKDKLVAVYRSADEDAARPVLPRTFDGIWHWTSKDHAEEPHVTLYVNILSKENPHLTGLDAAYRKLEATSRQSNCVSCHSPENISNMKKLTMMSYPNQALAMRRTLVKELEQDLMPPEDKQKNVPSGIHDKALKAQLVEAAKTFADVADKALDFEKKRVLAQP